MKNCSKKNCKITIYMGLFFLILLIHMPWDIISDDAVNLDLELSCFEYFVRQWRENGRYFTDSLAYFFLNGPFWVWKLFDSVLYVLLAKMTAYLFGEELIWDLASCGMILLFPFEYMISAGYIATSANYMYPVFCVILIFFCLKKIYEEGKVDLWQIVCMVLAAIYGTNHEQTGIALTVSLICASVFWRRWEERKRPEFGRILYGVSLLALLCFGISFFSPGHLSRMGSVREMEVWLPQYAQWSIATKLYRGYTSTVAVLLFQRQDLVTVFVAFMAALSLRKRFWAGAVPLFMEMAVKWIGYDHFVVFFPYSPGMPDIDLLENGVTARITLVLSVVIIGVTVISLYRIVEDRRRLVALYVLLFIAACTRGMMGFSATIYASSFRTFTCSLFAIGICGLALMKEWVEGERSWFCGVYGVMGLMAGIGLGR